MSFIRGSKRPCACIVSRCFEPLMKQRVQVYLFLFFFYMNYRLNHSNKGLALETWALESLWWPIYLYLSTLKNKWYKKLLIKTMVNCAFHLSFTWESFVTGCDHLKVMFTSFKYPESLINSTIIYSLCHLSGDWRSCHASSTAHQGRYCSLSGVAF